MKESTGAVSAIYIVIFFVVIMFGFVISTLSYYKSYKINNRLTAAIEDYGGFNKKSKKEIERRLNSYGYSKADIVCKAPDENSHERLIRYNEDGSIELTTSNNNLGYKGYCVYIVDDKSIDGGTAYEYYSYKVTTSMTLNFGIVDFNLPIGMSTHTSTMYSCYGGNLNCPDIN